MLNTAYTFNSKEKINVTLTKIQEKKDESGFDDDSDLEVQDYNE